jgi:hypothetical protein
MHEFHKFAPKSKLHLGSEYNAQKAQEEANTPGMESESDPASYG